MKTKRPVRVVKRDAMARALALKQYQPQRTPTRREALNKTLSKHAHKEQ
jgi:hypothetical protein